jgi:acyl carrier protein
MPATRSEILEALQTAFKAALPKSSHRLEPTDDLLDLGIGSIAALEMAASLEDHYGIRFPEEKLADLRTVGDFADLVEALLAQLEP